MNYLDTTNTGGHPLYLEDLGFIQDAYKEAIAGITQGLGADSYILSGCQKTLQSAGIWAISEGFVVLNKEVFKVPVHTVNFLNENAPLYFKIQNEPIYSTPVIYKETGEKDVHFRRRAIVTTENTEHLYRLPNLTNLLDKIGRVPSSNFDFLNGWFGNIEYRILGGVLHLNGSIFKEVTKIEDMTGILTTIPSALTPYYVGDKTLGNIAPNSGNSYWQSQALGHPVHLTRTLINSSNNIINITPSIAHIHVDHNLPAGRNATLSVVQPGSWAVGTIRAWYNFSGISWPIAPQ